MSTLTVYRTAPQQEFKAAKELRENGIRAYVPRDLTVKRKAPVARGYVFSKYKPAFAKHVKSRIGEVQPGELARIYMRRQHVKPPTTKFAPGDLVGVAVGVHANMAGRIVRQTKKGWMISTLMMGKQCEVFVPEKYLYRINHPPGGD